MIKKIKLFINIRSIESIVFFILDDLLHLLKILKFNPKNIKKNDILFILGSGGSLNDIANSDWEKISKIGDIMGFNDSIEQSFIELDYYIIREIFPLFLIGSKWRYASIFQSNLNINQILKLNKKIISNEKMKNTSFILLKDLLGGISTLWLWISYKRFGNRVICKYSNTLNRNASFPISKSMKNIPHAGSTLFDCINIGVNLGYDKIVLLGVDLYDSNYFYLKNNEERDWDRIVNHSKSSRHKTSETTIKNIEFWDKELKRCGVNLFIYNPKSLLNGILPLFKLNN